MQSGRRDKIAECGVRSAEFNLNIFRIPNSALRIIIMLTIRQIRRKIIAAQKTMQMVAASRVKKAEGRLQQAKPYAHKLEELLMRLSSTGQFSHPFFETRDAKNVCLVVVTGDRGLCGSYNANIILKAESFLRSQDKNVKLFLIGKKGFDYFRKRKWEILDKVTDISGKLDYKRIEDITNQLIGYYLSGTVDEVHLLYTSFRSIMSYQANIDKFLKIERPASKDEDKAVQYIFEPDVNGIFEKLLPKYVTTKIYISLAQSFTSENAS